MIAQGQLGEPLVPKTVEEKLNLTAEQKAKIAKIEKEFAGKHKDNEIKLRDLAQKARQDMDRAALKGAQEKLAEARTARADYEKQVQAVLTEEQRKAFQQPGTARRPGVAAGPSLLGGALPERLNLSAEQKEKLAQLQKEFEGKALQVLTEEQRKQYEQLKKGRTRPQQQSRQRRQTSLRNDVASSTYAVATLTRSW